MKLNNKGFTLVELLATVVILSILIAIMVPSVNYIIDKNKEDNYKSLEKNILSAAKIYLSDNRYNISLNYGEELCDNAKEDIASINGRKIEESKLPIQWLIDSKNLSTDSNGNIVYPKDNTQILDLNTSYVLIKYVCSSKDYTYSLEENSLVWKEKNT